MSYINDNRYWQRWTITINGKTEEVVRKAMSKVTINSFNLLGMDGIFSTSSASTKIEDRKEGDKMGIEPRTACEVGYEPETVYEARVKVMDIIHSIYFMFSRRTGIKRVSIRRADSTGSDWCSYYIETATEVDYYVPLGTWILRVHVGCSPDWLFKSKTDGSLHRAIVTKAWGIKGKHYDTVIEDDILEGKPTTAAERKKVVEWYEKAKKEVKGKMYLQLIEVTIFNRKTKHVDFHENVIAESNDEAYLLAVQAFGKYDPKVHVKAASCILGFNEFGDKNCMNDEEDE